MDIDDPNSLRELGPPAMRAFKAIAAAWDLSNAEQDSLLGVAGGNEPGETEGQHEPEVDAEILLRISYILGIYGALHVLFPNAPQAAAWLRASNAGPLFAGRSALEKMTSGTMGDLKLVRQYLEAECM